MAKDKHTNKKEKNTKIAEPEEVATQRTKANKDKKEKNTKVVVDSDIANTKPNKKEKQAKDKKNKPRKESNASNVSNDNDTENHENHESMSSIFENQLNIVNSSLKLDDNLIRKAINAMKILLDKRFEDELNILLRKDEEYLYLNFTLGNLPERYSLRPVAIPVLVNSKAKRRVCLIVKDPAQNWIDRNIDFSDAEDVDVNVIPFSELKAEYDHYDEKRNLLKLFDVFLCDNHIYFSLKKILGKNFYEDKKFPIGITIGNNNDAIKEEILKNSRNHLFYMSNGPNYTVKTGHVCDDTEELLKKVKTASAHTLAHILKWGVDFDQLKSISLKFTNSIELPIFNQLTPEEIKAGVEVLKEQKSGKKEETLKAKESKSSNGNGHSQDKKEVNKKKKK